LGKVEVTRGTEGEVLKGVTWSAAFPCAFVWKNISETAADNKVYDEGDAFLHTIATSNIEEHDRIKILSVYKQTLEDPMIFEVSSIIATSPARQRLSLKRIQI